MTSTVSVNNNTRPRTETDLIGLILNFKVYNKDYVKSKKEKIKKNGFWSDSELNCNFCVSRIACEFQCLEKNYCLTAV